MFYDSSRPLGVVHWAAFFRRVIVSAHSKLVKDAEKALSKVHSDTSVSLSTTFESLKELRDYVADLVECVRAELKDEEGDLE